MAASTDSESNATTPEVPSLSPGSSVSSGLQEQYNDFLKYAVVTPNLGPSLEGRAALKRTEVPRVDSLLQSTVTGAKPRESTRMNGTYLTSHDITDVIKVSSTDSSISSHVEQPKAPPQHPGGGQTELEHPHQVQKGGPPEGTQEEEEIVSTLSASSDMLAEPPPGGNRTQVPDHRDPEMVRLEMQLDNWCTDLKRNMLAEFAQCLMRLKDGLYKEMEENRKSCLYEVGQKESEVEQMKDLVATYEDSLAKKDNIIVNLTKALQKQKNKCDLQQSFSHWKLHHVDDKWEGFVSQLANRYYKRSLMNRVWLGWHSIIENKWRQRIEKACQARAEEVCVQLTNEYEEKIKVMQQSLDESRVEVQAMKQQRDLFADNMKRAFMRGVCALNMEAMTMFNSSKAPPETQQSDESCLGSEDESTQLPGSVNVALQSEPSSQPMPYAASLHPKRRVVQRGVVRPVEPHTVPLQQRHQSGQRTGRTSKKEHAVVVERHTH